MSRLLIVSNDINPTLNEIDVSIYRTKLKKRDIDVSNIEKLIPTINNEWSISEICKNAIPITWESTFEYAEAELDKISKILERTENKSFYPLKYNLFRALHLTKLSDVRVVIIGQDPYHTTTSYGEPIAQGLSFSVEKGLSIPPSLANIYKEIKENYPDFEIPNHGDLSKWSLQGVLMLNSCLTVLPGQPDSHSKFQLWMPFIVKVLEKIAEVRPDCIFCLWGKKSQELERYLGKKSIKLMSAHPSFYSAKNFFGNRHFIQINNILLDKGEEPIEW